MSPDVGGVVRNETVSVFGGARGGENRGQLELKSATGICLVSTNLAENHHPTFGIQRVDVLAVDDYSVHA